MSRLQTRGSGNAQAKMNERTVEDARLLHQLGVEQQVLARFFRVSTTQMYRIIHHVDWKHVGNC